MSKFWGPGKGAAASLEEGLGSHEEGGLGSGVTAGGLDAMMPSGRVD